MGKKRIEILPRNKKLKKNAQELRKNQTPEERRLWYGFLSGYDAAFRRQYVIGNYIVDFFCKRANLVIELDGSQHYEESVMRHDNRRTEYLYSLGIEVLRFTNDDVKKNFDGVCQMIDLTVKQRMRSKGLPSGEGAP